MNRFLTLLIEDGLAYFGIAGLVAFISFVTVAKIVLGSIIGISGAFIPVPVARTATGSGEISGPGGVKASVSGSIRVGVVLIGLIIVGYGFLDGYNEFQEAESARQTKREAMSIYKDCLKSHPLYSDCNDLRPY